MLPPNVRIRKSNRAPPCVRLAAPDNGDPAALTAASQLVAAGIIRPEEAAGHPLANVVTRAIGGEPDLAIDVVEDVAMPGDVFLLCPDGLDKCLSDAEVAALLDAPPALACEALVRAVLARGAPDNVGVVAVRLPG